MHIHSLSLHPYAIPLTNGPLRKGFLLEIIDEQGTKSLGDIAPLTNYSIETLEQAIEQLTENRLPIMDVEWDRDSFLKKLDKFALFPSVRFGLESTLLSLLSPLKEHRVAVSALLMGSSSEILNRAKIKEQEGYTSLKLKVGHLTFEQAAGVINELKDRFRLRVDVNRAWTTIDSLRFFSRFPLDSFDYVEEPFQNPQDLDQFSHPLAVDESFPKDLSLKELESLPTLKALIYKPTLQGGMSRCLPLCQWADELGIQIILSSSFESDVGLLHIATMAHRLSLCSSVGIGTYDYLSAHLALPPLQFSNGCLHIPHTLKVKTQ